MIKIFLITYCKNNNRYDILNEIDHEKNYLKLKKHIKNIATDSNEELFFRCKYGHEYINNLENIIETENYIHCPICKENKELIEHKVFQNSSIMEKLIAYYIQQVFPNALFQYKCKIYNKDAELDIFIEELNIVIEHDGKQHSSPESIMNDSAKSAGLKCKGIDVVRLQQNFNYQICSDKIITYKYKDKKDLFDNLSIAIKELFSYILEIRNLSSEQISLIKKLNINCNKDRFLVFNNALEQLKEVNTNIDDNIKNITIADIPTSTNKSNILNVSLEKEDVPTYSLTSHSHRAAQEFMSEKNGITPDKVATNCQKEYWFKCEKCGTEYKQAVNMRIGTGPHCK